MGSNLDTSEGLSDLDDVVSRYLSQLGARLNASPSYNAVDVLDVYSAREWSNGLFDYDLGELGNQKESGGAITVPEFSFAANAAAGSATATDPSGPLHSAIPGDTSTTASVALGTSVYGSLAAGEADWYRVQLTAGVQYEFRMHGVGVNQLVDPFLNLRNSAGTIVATNDDAGAATWGNFDHDPNFSFQDSRIVFTAASTGTYFIDAGSFELGGAGDFLLTAVTANPAGMVFTADEIAWQLTNNFVEYNGGAAAAFNVGADGSLTVNITGLTPAAQQMARDALEQWTDVTGINFTETTGAAEITFDDFDANSTTTAYASTNASNGLITSSNVIITQGWLTEFGTGFGSYTYETYIHEIGHALGLGHGGNYNGSATYGVDNFYLNDSVAYAIMSYMNARDDEFTQDGTGQNTFVNASFRYMQTTAIADIIAIQNLYGDHSTTRGGNTVYGFGSNTGNAALDNAVTLGASMFMTVYDDGGIDTLNFSGTSAAQVINLAPESFSNVLGGVSNLSIARGVVIENATGGSGADTIYGNSAANTLIGLGGADLMQGFGGNDVYGVDNVGDIVDEGLAGAGIDTVNASITINLSDAVHFKGAIENATLIGSANLNVTGNALANVLTGNAGANTLIGLGGADTMRGLGGSDLYGVDNAGDIVDESVAGSSGIDTVNGSISINLSDAVHFKGSIENAALIGAANLYVYGNALANVLTGNAGANTLVGYAGADTMRGVGGNDIYGVDNAGDIVDEAVAGSGGIDTVNGSISINLSDAVHFKGSIENASLIGSANLNVTGNALANVLTGNAGANTLIGLGGNDTMRGGAGNDLYGVAEAGDIVDESVAGSNGIDTVNGSISINLSDAVHFKGAIENATVIGSANLYVYGNALANVLTGNAGANTLIGYAGADTMRGLAGNDVYGVDNTGDIVDESVAGSSGVDTVNGSISINLSDAVHFKGAIENATVIGSANLYVYGNALANVLTGNAGANTLIGYAGADTMRGLAGNDVYGIDNAGDIVDESVAGSNGVDTVNASISININDAAHFKGAIENASLVGSANLSLTGNTLGNVLNGNAGANVITGWLGNDTLTGGGGNDVFLFNSALNATTNRDVITDMNQNGNDTIRLENAIFTTLAAGALVATAFHIGAAAADANDRIIYNSANGQLFYDSNGNAAGGSTLFAILDPSLTLTAADFFVV